MGHYCLILRTYQRIVLFIIVLRSHSGERMVNYSMVYSRSGKNFISRIEINRYVMLNQGS
jgi:hypothetical protein